MKFLNLDEPKQNGISEQFFNTARDEKICQDGLVTHRDFGDFTDFARVVSLW